jgi:hypothetical protein
LRAIRVAGVRVTAIRITEVGGGDGVVGDSDRGEDALNDGSDGSVGVALNSGVSEVSSETVGLDDGAVMSRSTDEGGGWDVESVGGGQANQEDGDLENLK